MKHQCTVTQRERQRQRQRQRQTDRQTDRDRDTETERDRERQRETEREFISSPFCDSALSLYFSSPFFPSVWLSSFSHSFSLPSISMVLFLQSFLLSSFHQYDSPHSPPLPPLPPPSLFIILPSSRPPPPITITRFLTHRPLPGSILCFPLLYSFVSLLIPSFCFPSSVNYPFLTLFPHFCSPTPIFFVFHVCLLFLVLNLPIP